MTNPTPDSLFDNAFSSDAFRDTGHRVVDMLAGYLKSMTGRGGEKVLPDIDPDDMMNRWKGRFTGPGGEDWEALLKKVIKESNHLHHPRYIGHQCTAPLPLAAVMDFVGDFLNNGSAVYEMGPVNVAMERRLIQWMCRRAGFGSGGGGVFTSGGTLGNLTALLAARQVQADHDVWNEGVGKAPSPVVLVAEDSHYSVKRAVGIMGLGENAAIPVALDASFRMDLGDLQKRHGLLQRRGRKVLALVAKGCSTATGTFDDLVPLGEFCREHGIWFHLDGAHGASALLSGKHRHRLRGIETVDSLVWDAHKMLLMPALTTAVLYRNHSHSYAAFSQEASYLFEKEPTDEWYNYAHRTMECTKKMMGLKLYVCLSVLGEDFFARYIDTTFDRTREFSRLIEEARDFELAVPPESNIICFRYLPGNTDLDVDDLQCRIRRALLKEERFYVVQTRIRERQYLRCTLINPLTTLSDLRDLLTAIRNIGRSFSG